MSGVPFQIELHLSLLNLLGKGAAGIEGNKPYPYGQLMASNKAQPSPVMTVPIATAQNQRSTMTLEEALELVEKALDKGCLNKAQELVFRESW